jgi:DNA-binding transcriptional LysR family regulator
VVEVEVGHEDALDADVRLVRVTAPPAVAYELLTPFAAAVAAAHPSIRVEVASSTRVLDLARGEADLALRARPPATPDLVQVASVPHANKVFVARALAARLPPDATLETLPWIAWAPPFEHLTPNPELEAAIPGFIPRFTADDFLVQLRACELGLGAMVLADYDAAERAKRGLVPLPHDLGTHARGLMYLVAPRSALDIPRVRRVADLLVARLEQDGGRRRAPLRPRDAALEPTPRAHPKGGSGRRGPRQPRGGKSL